MKERAMPMIRVQVSIEVPQDKQQELLTKLSKSVAAALSKPESYMMVLFEPQISMLMGGKADPAAFVEVRSVGSISEDQARQLSNTVSQTLDETLKIQAARVYTNFAGVPGAMWGFSGRTFG